MQLTAISYDSVDILKTFAKKAKIEFALLSDPKSQTIEAYGLRNQDLAGSKIDGVPHPGTIIVGQDGKIAAKLFHEGYRKRHVAQEILEAVGSQSTKPAD